MVSIHRILIVLYMTIRVLCFVFRFKYGPKNFGSMERDMNYDLELARYIWSILKSDLPVLMSWGVEIETVKVIKCGIEFKVNGFKHTGKVQIVLNEGTDLFGVCLIGEDGEIRDKREDIYLDMLVSVVDGLVEKTDDYEKRIAETYNIIRY